MATFFKTKQCCRCGTCKVPDPLRGGSEVKPAPCWAWQAICSCAAGCWPHKVLPTDTEAGLSKRDPLDMRLPVCLQASGALQDGAAQKPSYSLRTLCRALDYCRTAVATYGLQRALLDGLSMAFMTQLDTDCAAGMEQLISRHVLGSDRAVQVSS